MFTEFNNIPSDSSKFWILFLYHTLLIEDTLAKKKKKSKTYLHKLTTVIKVIWQQPEYECTKITSLVAGKQNLA